MEQGVKVHPRKSAKMAVGKLKFSYSCESDILYYSRVPIMVYSRWLWELSYVFPKTISISMVVWKCCDMS